MEVKEYLNNCVDLYSNYKLKIITKGIKKGIKNSIQFEEFDNITELNNSYFQYYAELKQEFPKIYDLSPGEGHTAIGWNDITINHPQQIAYYLDFIDENSGLGQYSVNNIGRRSKVIEDSNEGINCVFEPDIPNFIIIEFLSSFKLISA